MNPERANRSLGIADNWIVSQVPDTDECAGKFGNNIERLDKNMECET